MNDPKTRRQTFTISSAVILTGLDRETIKNWRRRGIVRPGRGYRAGDQESISVDEKDDWEGFDRHDCIDLFAIGLLTRLGVNLGAAQGIVEQAANLDRVAAFEQIEKRDSLSDDWEISSDKIAELDRDSYSNHDGPLAARLTLKGHEVVGDWATLTDPADATKAIAQITIDMRKVAEEVDQRISLITGMIKDRRSRAKRSKTGRETDELA